MSAENIPPGAEPTRYTFTIPRPGYPDEPEYVNVIPMRGGWNRGPIEGWCIIRGDFDDYWTRDRAGFEFRPGTPERTRWPLAEALTEAAEHAVPWLAAHMRM